MLDRTTGLSRSDGMFDHARLRPLRSLPRARRVPTALVCTAISVAAWSPALGQAPTAAAATAGAATARTDIGVALTPLIEPIKARRVVRRGLVQADVWLISELGFDETATRVQKAISTQQYDELEHAVDRARDEVALAEVARDTAKRNLSDTRIAAPFAGTVDSIAVDVGDFVSAGTPVAVLVDLARVRIMGSVTAGEAARLVPGTTARVTFRDLGGTIFEARLESVARVASPTDGTYAIELHMDDPSGRLRDGLVATVELPDADSSPRLLTKRAALLRRSGHPEVFVIDGQGESAVARSRRVRTGRSAGEWIEVLDGLTEGERVVWDGHFALDDGATLGRIGWGNAQCLSENVQDLGFIVGHDVVIKSHLEGFEIEIEATGRFKRHGLGSACSSLKLRKG